MKAVSSTHVKLGQRIKELRSKLDLTQEDLAFKAGFDRSYIGFVERGERNPSLSTLMKVARVLRVSIKELFD